MNKYRIYVKVSSRDRSKIDIHTIKAKTSRIAEDKVSMWHDYHDELLENYVIMNCEKIK